MIFGPEVIISMLIEVVFFFLEDCALPVVWCLGMSCLWRPLITYLKASTKSISS